MAIVTYNDNGIIKVVKFGTCVVSTDADPVVQKEWVFLNGTTDPGDVNTFEGKGALNATYENEGCSIPDTLVSLIDSQYPASELPIGTRAAARMNAIIGTDTCGTWALFEVQAV